MNERLFTYCQQKNGSTWYQPAVSKNPDDNCFIFQLEGKIFALFDPKNQEIVLKGPPERNSILREEHPTVILPGRYLNKNHWNSIKINAQEIGYDQITYMIDQSYTSILSNLTNAQKKKLEKE